MIYPDYLAIWTNRHASDGANWVERDPDFLLRTVNHSLDTIRLHSTESYHIRNSSRVPGWIVSRFPFQHSSTTHPSLSTIFISEQFSIESRLDVAIDMSDYPTDVVGFLRFHVD